MSALSITIAGNHYDVACDDGQEAHLRHLASLLDGHVRSLSKSMARTSEAHLLMLTALTLADELHDTARELETLRVGTVESAQAFEKTKQIDLESAVAATIHDISARIESLADVLESV